MADGRSFHSHPIFLIRILIHEVYVQPIVEDKVDNCKALPTQIPLPDEIRTILVLLSANK